MAEFHFSGTILWIFRRFELFFGLPASVWRKFQIFINFPLFSSFFWVKNRSKITLLPIFDLRVIFDLFLTRKMMKKVENWWKSEFWGFSMRETRKSTQNVEKPHLYHRFCKFFNCNFYFYFSLSDIVNPKSDPISKGQISVINMSLAGDQKQELTMDIWTMFRDK